MKRKDRFGKSSNRHRELLAAEQFPSARKALRCFVSGTGWSIHCIFQNAAAPSQAVKCKKNSQEHTYFCMHMLGTLQALWQAYRGKAEVEVPSSPWHSVILRDSVTTCPYATGCCDYGPVMRCRSLRTPMISPWAALPAQLPCEQGLPGRAGDLLGASWGAFAHRRSGLQCPSAHQGGHPVLRPGFVIQKRPPT